jgi:hypothetical protein
VLTDDGYVYGHNWLIGNSQSYIANFTWSTKTWHDIVNWNWNEWCKSIPPSVVDNVTDSYSLGYSYQTHTIYANNYYWMFYSNGSYMKYASSTDGMNWQSFNITTCTYGYKFSIAYNNTAVWYALVNGSVNAPILYRQGTFNNGQISWTAEQIAVSPANEYIQFNYPNIIIDSNGYAFISYFAKHIETGETWLNCTKNSYAYSSNWQTVNNFPYMFEHNAGEGGVGVTLLSNGKLVFVYLCGATANHIYYATYNGTFNKVDWIPETVLTSTQMFSVSSYQNTVFITSMTGTIQLYCVGGAYADLTSDPYTTVDTTNVHNAYPSIAVQGYKNIIFYIYSSSLKYAVGIPTESNVWNSYAWFSESSGDYIRALSSFKTANSENIIGVAYVKQYDSSSQYEVKFAGLYMQSYAKIWQDIASWIYSMFAMIWTSICAWSYNVFSQAWRDLVNWLFSLHTIGWNNIAWFINSIYSTVVGAVVNWGLIFGIAVSIGLCIGILFSEDEKRKSNA